MCTKKYTKNVEMTSCMMLSNPQEGKTREKQEPEDTHRKQK